MGLASGVWLSPLLAARPLCRSGATPLDSADAHADRGTHASRCRVHALRATRRGARANGAWADGGVSEAMGHRRIVRTRVMDTKKPGRARRRAIRFLAPYFTWRQEAANHHDFSCLCESTRRLACRQAPRHPSRASRDLRFAAALPGVRHPRAPVTEAHPGKVVHVCRASRFRSAESHCRPRVRASRPAWGSRTFRASSSTPPPRDDPFALLDHLVT